MSQKKTNLLVLGVGGNVSQGILKAITRSSVNCHVIGGCIDSHAMGLYMCDQAVITPLATYPVFVKWLIETCNKYDIAGVMCGVWPVLNVKAENKTLIEESTNAKLIVSSYDKFKICGDKLLTAEWLKENGLNYPRSVDAQDENGIQQLVQDCQYPLFAKPRDGKGSQGIMKIKSAEDLAIVKQKTNFVIQEYLGDAASEYTAATFTDCSGLSRGCIIFRRQLLEGTTVSAEVVDSQIIREEVMAITSALKPMGPCNIQLRMDKERPVCFEINLRYSGTTPIRANLGFNDVEAGIRHYILGEQGSELPHVTRGVALRYWNEIYIDPDLLNECKESGELAVPTRAIQSLETFGRRA